jgi:hypothetical protein
MVKDISPHVIKKQPSTIQTWPTQAEQHGLLASPDNGWLYGKLRLRAISYQVIQKLKRAAKPSHTTETLMAILCV